MRADYVLVGGGLQNGLIALGLLHRDPDCRVVLVERASRVGGNHTWCFHAADVDPAARPWVDALPAHRWPGYSVHFPDRERMLDEPYALIASTDFAAAIESAFAAAPNATLLTSITAVDVTSTSVTLADGRTLSGAVVIDARGPDRHAVGSDCGFQKFVGLEVDLDADHGLDRPILMDACVAQTDGFRFFYVLPLGARRLLIEDTYFSDSAHLDRAALTRTVEGYVAERGWTIERVVRREHGVLPLPWTAPADAPDDGVLRAGFQGGFYHPVTGYSLPVACRVATLVVETPPAALPAALARLRAEVKRRQRFCHLLNRSMFPHCPPERRWELMSRFYRRPAGVIRRFYAMRMTAWDRFIAVAGPIPGCLTWRPRSRVALEEKAA